jgi:putrescine transport system ATP-binding protein
MATRIAVMHEGRLRQVGTPQAIYESPIDRFVADFIGNVNLLDGQVEAVAADHAVVACTDVRQHIGHRLQQSVGDRVTVALRPEKIHLSRHVPPQPGLNAVQGTVRDMAYFGSFTLYHLALASGATLKISHPNLQRHREDEPQPGDAAWAHWSREAQVVLVS